MYELSADGIVLASCNIPLQDGWFEFCRNTFYAENAQLVINQRKEIDGYICSFDVNGVMAKNMYLSYLDAEDQDESTEDSLHYFDENGHLVYGWFTDVYGNEKYADLDTGKICENSLFVLEGILYHLNADGSVLASASIDNGWAVLDGNTYYVENGTLIQNQRKEIDGYTYSFDEKGAMQKNCSLYYANEDADYCEHYFDENGHLVYGWFTDEAGNEKYADEKTGSVLTGWLSLKEGVYYLQPEKTIGWLTLNDVTYYFDESGLMCTGWTTINKSDYYFSATGSKVLGFFADENRLFYLYPRKNGAKIVSDIVRIDGVFYNFDGKGYITNTKPNGFGASPDGPTVTGWKESDEGLKYYWTGTNFAQGLIAADNTPYLFSEAGLLYKDDIVVAQGYMYLIDENGVVLKIINIAKEDGWHSLGSNTYYAFNGDILKNGFQNIDDYIWYFDADGAILKNTTLSIVNEDLTQSIYRFDESGHALTGWYIDETGNTYYYDENGVQQFGWLYLESGTYYLNSDGSKIVSATKIIDDITYDFDENGIASVHKEIKTGWQSEDGYDYYYDEAGNKVTGWKEIDGVKYYLDPENDGAKVISATKTIDGITYAFDENGIASIHVEIKTGWQNENGHDCYYDEAGNKVTGWKEIDGAKYYLDPENDGAKVISATKTIEGITYDFDENGVASVHVEIKTGWQSEDGHDYYYNENGNKVTGWKEIDGVKYYLDSENDGAKVVSATKTIEGITYDFDENGSASIHAEIKTGWQSENGHDYYYDETGSKVTGWKEVDGTKYYFDPDNEGAKTVSTSKKIDGTTYYFDQNGKTISAAKYTTEQVKTTVKTVGNKIKSFFSKLFTIKI
jgi:glucan-binding YG repeat protein/uncharacterized protein YkuJ